ncbi:organic acid transporter [Trichosporon asahii var. asahii CBS 8904]|uniref:Organic acid transporter n=1 Tax=Trichosporon asahii var. asahii (strain CBS 8904) TaxID=1220162 RepID=K1WRP2_TRIAC|nr:organic acid transporter [Trichosporon asahii var. asahii CBS 8904]
MSTKTAAEGAVVPHKPAPLPFAYTFAAGAIAGVTELLVKIREPSAPVTHLNTKTPPEAVHRLVNSGRTLRRVRSNNQMLYPLDVLKTRQQLDSSKNPPGMVQTFKNIVKQEGVGRLYRGIASPLLMEAPKRAVKFAANGWWGNVFTDGGKKKTTQPIAMLTGMAAGATESFLVTPFELVKIRMQDKNSTYKGPMDVVKKVIAQKGPLGIYQGMEPTFWRHVWWNGGYFGSIFQVKALLPKAEGKEAEMINNLIAGTIGGFVGTVLNTPFDVVKSRLQLHATGEWTYPALFRIAREEGIGALYKGFAPKVLRLAPGGGVLLLVVEALSTVFRKQLGPPYI